MVGVLHKRLCRIEGMNGVAERPQQIGRRSAN
jgi:hypothetical protein